MKLMGIFLVIGQFAHAGSLTLYCTSGGSREECARHVEQALRDVGCSVEATTTKCEFTAVTEDNRGGAGRSTATPYCEVVSDRCEAPFPGLFGAEYCYSKRKLSIPKSAGVHNGYSVFPYFSQSRTVCRAD